MTPIGPVTTPHPPLTDYYESEAQRSQYVRRIFDETAIDYDRIERILALGSGDWYRQQALRRAGVRRGAAVLDVGFGTGLLARQALKLIGPQGTAGGRGPKRRHAGPVGPAGSRTPGRHRRSPAGAPTLRSTS